VLLSQPLKWGFDFCSSIFPTKAAVSAIKTFAFASYIMYAFPIPLNAGRLQNNLVNYNTQFEFAKANRKTRATKICCAAKKESSS